MARVKGAMMTRKRRNKTLKLAKGYWGNKSRHFKMANQAVMKSLTYAYTGRKEQTKSKAAIRSCTHSFAQRVQSAYCQASDGGVEGVRPLARFLTAFSRKKAVSPKADAFRPHRRAAAAARSSPNRKPQ